MLRRPFLGSGPRASRTVAVAGQSTKRTQRTGPTQFRSTARNIPAPTKVKMTATPNGFSGDLEPSQGIEYLLKSIEHFQDVIPTFQIIIVGDGGEKKNLLWLSKMIGLGQKVRFVGRQAEVKKWYSYFDILVLPRIEKINFSQTAAEAMAAGVPIANPVAGISVGLVKESDRWVLLTGLVFFAWGEIYSLFPSTCTDTFGTATTTTLMGSGTAPVAFARSIACRIATYWVAAAAAAAAAQAHSTIDSSTRAWHAAFDAWARLQVCRVSTGRRHCPGVRRFARARAS